MEKKIPASPATSTKSGTVVNQHANSGKTPASIVQLPSIALPQGGGAIKGIEEKFQVNSVTGTSSFAIPIPLSPSRQGFTPSLGLSYNSGSGNGQFGLGWQIGVPSISRKTEKKFPTYNDEQDTDTFILAGSEDLVPLLEEQGTNWIKSERPVLDNGISYTIKRFRPRIEGSFTRIERWKNIVTGEVHWKTITADNIHSYYGLTGESRVSDPTEPKRVFEWLLCRMHDDKGNVVVNKYKTEDFALIDNKLSEKNRIGKCTQVYLKQVLYGNKQPYYLGDQIPAENDFMFRVVLDYGEHDSASAVPKDVDIEKNEWAYRKDPFSDYRSGFEIRTYRRCNRILVFHSFQPGELPHSPYLTRSVEFVYDDEATLTSSQQKIKGFSFLVKSRQNGHRWDATSGTYTTKHLPELDINYQQHEWNTEIKNVTNENLVHAPAGLSAKNYLWIDLFSEGISGILTEQANGWFYKSNLGNGDFSKAAVVAPKPNFNGLSSNLTSIQELEGNGVKYLVSQSEPRGFFKLDEEEKWNAFKSFSSLPNIDLLDPNLRSLDLNGDGLVDLLITEENQFRWYPGAGEKGFEVSQTVTKEIDEEKGPAIVFADSTQSIFLADMNGDGLTDIVRIRNGEICYWPNLGYGRFGSKVSMDNPPLFDHPDIFYPGFLRLADIDGSGTIDVIYLGKNDFRVWMNLNGNEWSLEPKIIQAFPNIDDLADVAVLDFLGSGTACIVHSSPVSQQPLRYIDLMGGKKPHLLNGYQNNCGKEVTITYKPSTHFYLADKKLGNKWITRLPFPVHCIHTVRSEDKIRDTVFTSTYSYRHGYFDHEEREFRGFARTEQLDTEDFDQFKLNAAKNVVEEKFHQPPIRTISWFHTGAYLRGEKILHQCKDEYFKNTSFAEYDIPGPLFEDDLSLAELREAYRACKGLPLRSEVYSDDKSEKAKLPYSASESSFQVRRVQPRAENKHASFQVVPSESVAYSYERNPADPRISHSLILETDKLGNPLKTSSVVYPRVARPVAPDDIPDKVWDEQNKTHVVYNEAGYTKDVISADVYRLRVGCESKAYEISGVIQPAGFFFTKAYLADRISQINADPNGEILFEVEFGAGPQKRLSAHSRTYFINNAFNGPLNLGDLSPLGIPFTSSSLVFTKDLVTKYYGNKVTDEMLVAAKYIHSEGDKHWWAQSGTAIYTASPKNDFYIPVGARDVFGNESFVSYDSYKLLTESVTDAIGNSSSVKNDYRTLSPFMLIDANLNRGAAETDELGLVIKSAIMGKDGNGDGDTMADPTARMEYDLFNWQNNKKPNYVHMFAREKHGAANPRWQESYVYSDGGGGVIMTKAQAKPGQALRWNTTSKQVEEIPANPRWIGNGRTIVNNKGNAIKQFEPYFSTTHEYETEDALVETGISPLAFYDPTGRNIRTEFPNGTFSKVEFDSWAAKSFDVNDTVKDSQWYADRGSPDPDTDQEPVDSEQRAAWLAAKHYNTPGVVHSDSLGRTFYTISDYGNGKTAHSFSETDLAGRYSKVFDQKDRDIAESYTNLGGQVIYGKSAEKGERWVFNDVAGRLVKIWDNTREFRTTFDKLHRPVSAFMKENQNEFMFSHILYADYFFDQATAQAMNMSGRAYRVYDQSGSITIKDVDFKGNGLAAERKLVKDYKARITNWKVLEGLTSLVTIDAAANPLLENETFSGTTEVDALNRPTLLTVHGGTAYQPFYNEGNGLDSMQVKIHGQGSFVTFLEGQDYDAKGQRQFAKYGNGVTTKYSYDPKTYRLVNLLTKLNTGDSDPQAIQNLKYTFDPVGNITQIGDDAQQKHFFRNDVVYPENKYVYDAIYQLTQAMGREHAGLGGDSRRNNIDLPFLPQLPHANDLTAVRTYTENYEYDDCGNIKLMQHRARDANWNRGYKYEYEDDAANKTNRLKGTSAEGDAAGVFSDLYFHDLHGNMTSMPHLSTANSLVWNFMDQLKEVNLGGGGKAYYVYGSDGGRIRKVIERLNGRIEERIYLGAVEIYREKQGVSESDFERYTIHVSDNTGRIAQVDIKTIDDNNRDTVNGINDKLIRYQYGNHLGSASLETDGAGNVISYEEYHPYGTSAYRVSRSDVDLSLKRYRFSGKERDEETGFYYFGARYYASWLGRWTSSDPAGAVDGMNLYVYCRNNPIMKVDKNGLDSSEPLLSSKKKDQPEFLKDPNQKARAVDYYNNNRFLVRDEDYDFIYDWDNAQVEMNDKGYWEPSNGPHAQLVSTPVVTDKPQKADESAGKNGGTVAPSPEKPDGNVVRPDSLTHLGAGLEELIWGRSPFDRGYTLEHLYNDNYMDAWRATRDNRPNYDVETPTHVKQIKSNEGTDAGQLRKHSSKATRDAGQAISDHPGMTGKSPQAVVVTPTDAPATAGTEIRAGYDNIQDPVPNSSPPEHVKGVPGTAGRVTRGMTYGGAALSYGFLLHDLWVGDYTMAVADAISTIAGGLAIHAMLTPGAIAIAGITSFSAGLALGGVGMALASGIGAVRDFKAGNYGWAAVGALGVLAGAAVTLGVIFGSPFFIGAGLIVGLGVGLLQLGRWIFSWFD